ncbi:MAG: hypothetical protein WDA75_22715 [Candidatus Latescibacterota bacterium]|jgi:hypothetical protein
MTVAPDSAPRPALPRDPYEALTLENDILGVRLWGPPTQPTLSVGRADLWDRRWFGERQPLVTLAWLRELAAADRLTEVARDPNRTVYGLYNQYEFPCPKPGGQVILGLPSATEARGWQRSDGVTEMVVSGPGFRLRVEVWVSLTRSLVVIDCVREGGEDSAPWVRVWRHRDTLRPGQPLSGTLGNGITGEFEPMAPPLSFGDRSGFGVVQRFPQETTFPEGFEAALVAVVLGPRAEVALAEGVLHLGTPLWAEQEGRLDHGVIKQYTPINESPGAAATATLTGNTEHFTVLAALATSHDGPRATEAALTMLREACALGVAGLAEERSREREQARRKDPAAIRTSWGYSAAAAPQVLPRLRRPDGYYSDVPLCTVGGTRLWFQDVGLWHNDFHLNEVRAEPMLTLGQAPELLPFCELIATLLPMAEENAREVYSLPGAMYPLVHFPLRTRGICHTNLTWEQDVGLNGLICKPLWLYFRHTGDLEFLRRLAWPVLRACARFCRAYLSEEEDGRLHLVPSVSPEHWGLTPRFERNRDCLSALTLTRYLLRAAAEASTLLDADVTEAADWLQAADRLAPYPTAMTEAGPMWVDVAGAPPIEYNVPVPLAAVFWGDDVGLDSPPEVLALARRTLGQIRIWQPHSFYVDACICNRLGVWQEGARLAPENFLLSYQSIHLFPCVPPEGEITVENLAAEGGFLVSAVRCSDGQVGEVRLRSRLGGPCRVASPWPDRGVIVRAEGKDPVASTGPGAAHLEFASRPGVTYTLGPR